MNNSSADNSLDKVDGENLLENLWRARDFEIEHLWQRSVFLATFLVLLFTVYFTQYNEIQNSSVTVENVETAFFAGTFSVKSGDNGEWFEDLLMLLGICEAGFILSTLWIAMARGSKTAYERIEEGINSFHERCQCLFDKEADNLQRKMFFDRMWKFGTSDLIPRHGTLPFPKKINPHSTLRTGIQTGYFYSVSKINIALGYVFIIAWTLLFFVSIRLQIANWLVSIILFALIILIDYLLVFTFCNYLILSDNSMKYSDYRAFIRRCDRYHAKNDSDNKQWEFIREFFFGIGDILSKEVVESTVEVLKNYLGDSEYSVEQKLISEFVNECDGYGSISEKEQLQLIRNIWQGYYRTQYIIETAMMYRKKLPGCTKLTFSDANNSNCNIILTQEEDISLDIQVCFKTGTNDVQVPVNGSASGGKNKDEDTDNLIEQEKSLSLTKIKNFRLYFDNNWLNVHSKYNKSSIPDCSLLELLNNHSNFYLFFSTEVIVKIGKEKDLKYIKFEPVKSKWYDGASGKNSIFSDKYKISFYAADGSELKCSSNIYNLVIV